VNRFIMGRRTPEVCVVFVIIACVAVVGHIIITTLFR